MSTPNCLTCAHADRFGPRDFIVCDPMSPTGPASNPAAIEWLYRDSTDISSTGVCTGATVCPAYVAKEPTK